MSTERKTQPKSQAKSGMKRVTLKNIRVMEMFYALAGLDGYQKAHGDKIINVIYEIEPLARLDLAYNKSILRPYKESYDDAHNGIINELSDGAGAIPQTIENARGVEVANPVYAEYQKKMKILNDKTVTVDLHTVTLRDLHIGIKNDPKANPIALTVIEPLLPFISDAASNGATPNDTTSISEE